MTIKELLLKERNQLTRELLLFREMLPGSFSKRRITCEKSNFVCIKGGKLHKAYQLTYRFGGKTMVKMIPIHKAEEVERRVF